MNMKRAEQFFGGIEKRWGVMISGDKDNVAAGGCRHPAKEAVIEFLPAIARSADVKYISGHKKGIDFLFLNRISQPVQKRFEFLIALPPIQCPPDMPVRCVKDFHVVLTIRDCRL
jgi:hypothetical protein